MARKTTKTAVTETAAELTNEAKALLFGDIVEALRNVPDCPTVDENFHKRVEKLLDAAVIRRDRFASQDARDQAKAERVKAARDKKAKRLADLKAKIADLEKDLAD
jgi:hypothetical protein